MVLVDFSILGHHHQQLDRHLRWEERERGREWERMLSGRATPAVLGDTAAAYRAEHQRLHRWRSGLRWAIAAVLAAGSGGDDLAPAPAWAGGLGTSCRRKGGPVSTRVLRRVGAMALLWSVVLFAFFWTLNFHQAFGLRQALMEEAQEEAAGGMAGIQLRDSAEWEGAERRFEARISEMRNARRVTGTLLMLVPVAGAAATLWILRRGRRGRADPHG